LRETPTTAIFQPGCQLPVTGYRLPVATPGDHTLLRCVAASPREISWNSPRVVGAPLNVVKMKIKITPLFVISICVILYGLYVIYFVDPGEEGWGTLAGIVITAIGLFAFIVYLVLRFIFRDRVWSQVFTEIVLICLCIIVYNFWLSD
jgi:hypothetical protein